MALNLLFLDFETTGLDPETCQIIECAAILRTADHAVVHVVDACVAPIAKDAAWEPDAHKMHVVSGLLQEWYTRTLKPTVSEVEGWLLRSVEPYGPRSVILAGNSIHFDRGFIRVHMPRLHAALHYRHMDVSCLMNFFAEHAAIQRPPSEQVAHRAMADVRASMEAYGRLAAWTRSRATPDATGGGF